MVSIIITTYKEKFTLPKAIQAILDQTRTNADPSRLAGESGEAGLTQINAEYEILVVGPDEETKNIVRNFQRNLSISANLSDRIKQRTVGQVSIRYLKDEGRGKPTALNLAFYQAQGDILVLTDGDVWIKKNALKYLLEPFENSKIGAVSGQPVSANSKDNIFGYWSHFLTEAAHQMRLNVDQRGKSASRHGFPCSGYLYAIRGGLIQQIPENVLAEDAVITQIVREQGYRVVYAPEAKVYVKYPDNFKDWLRQKVRATGGYKQKSQILNPKSQINSPPTADPPYLKIFKNKVAEKLKIQDSKIGKTRGFWQEIGDGLKLFFTYPKSLKEFWWTILLYLARLYLWFLIFWQIKIRRQKIGEIWQRIESTK